MPLVWVTGSSGVGKSTVCALLKSRGELAVDAD
jgi:dephospho-CoA kinase